MQGLPLKRYNFKYPLPRASGDALPYIVLFLFFLQRTQGFSTAENIRSARYHHIGFHYRCGGFILSLTHCFLHERSDLFLFGGSHLFYRKGDRPHVPLIELSLVLEAKRRISRLEFVHALEEADYLAVLCIRGHPVPESQFGLATVRSPFWTCGLPMIQILPGIKIRAQNGCILFWLRVIFELRTLCHNRLDRVYLATSAAMALAAHFGGA
jgi:hypothetical protein